MRKYEKVAKVIKANDKNSDILEVVEDYHLGRLDEEVAEMIINQEIRMIMSDVNGIIIKDYFLDETGRFEVEPVDYYLKSYL